MDDLEKYIANRKKNSIKFAKNFESGFENFKIGEMLRQAREEKGMTQEQLAENIHTTKSAISRMENHAEDIKLSTLNKIAKALGKSVNINID